MDQKKMAYEQEMERQKIESHQKAMLKQTQIEKVIEQNNLKEEERKQSYYNSVKEAEARKKELEEKKKIEIEQKHQENLAKNQKRIDVKSFYYL